MHAAPPVELDELVRRAARTLRTRWATVLEPWQLSPHQARALRVVITAGSLRLSELAEQLRVAPRSVTDVVDALQERGLVQRAPVPGDRRATTVVPTDAARTVITEIDAARQADAEAYFSPLSDQERSQLIRLLSKIVNAA